MIAEFLSALSGLHPRVKLDQSGQRSVWFTRSLWDTPHRVFAAHGFKLRTRAYDEYVACTFKVAGLDRYAIDGAPTFCIDPTAKEKLEEGIYAFHSSFSKQSTTKQPVEMPLASVRDWARLFPGAASVASPDEPLFRIASSRVFRLRKLTLDFDGTLVDAMLEIHYSTLGTPEKVEFSWKHRNKHEQYAPETARLMRTFLQCVNQTAWADTSPHLKKAVSDGASNHLALTSALHASRPAPRLLEGTPSQILRRVLEPVADPAE